jgi:hypothetical protein
MKVTLEHSSNGTPKVEVQIWKQGEIYVLTVDEAFVLAQKLQEVLVEDNQFRLVSEAEIKELKNKCEALCGMATDYMEWMTLGEDARSGADEKLRGAVNDAVAALAAVGGKE